MAFTKITAAGIGTTESVTLDGLSVINNGSFGGNLTVGGVLTYEDVTNVDSVGLITARNGIVVGSGITLSKDGDIFATGITTVSGNVKVGTGITISPDGDVFATGVTTTGSLVSSGAVSGTTGTFTGDVSIADAIVHTGDNSKIRFPSNDTITFETSGSEGIRVDAGGRLLVGTENARTFGGSVYAHLQLEGTTQQGSQFTITRNTNDTYAPNISLVKTRGTSDGAVTTVQDNDTLGTIQFRGADGSDVFAVAATIAGEVDGSPSDGTDMPGALTFATTAEGAASPTERVRIDSSGKLLVGTSSDYAENVQAAFYGASNGGIALASGTSGSSRLMFADGTSGSGTGAYIGSIIYAHSDNSMRFTTNVSERLRINSDGNVLINTTATPTGYGNLNIFGTDSIGSRLSIRRGSADTNGPQIWFNKSRNTTDGSHTVVQSGDTLGSIAFTGNDGQGPEFSARIMCEVDGTPGSNDMPGRLVFSTTPDGSDTLVERLRIDSNGNMGLGASPLSRLSVTDALSSGTMMTIRNTQSRANGVRYGIEFRDSSNEANGTISMEQTGSNNGAEMRFNVNNGTGGNGITNGTNSVTFEAGSQFFNCTSSPSSGTSGQRCESGGTFVIGLSVTTAKNAVEINNPNGNVGRITSSGSGVTYHTSSDYRLKENETTISDGITRLKTLIPRKFNWKADSTKTLEDGFFAHEVSSVVPEAVDGVKDAIYTEDNLDRGITKGDPIYQMIDHSRLVPLLTAALQEAITKIETLESEVAALKSS